jgi:hypothetical protein
MESLYLVGFAVVAVIAFILLLFSSIFSAFGCVRGLPMRPSASAKWSECVYVASPLE